MQGASLHYCESLGRVVCRLLVVFWGMGVLGAAWGVRGGVVGHWRFDESSGNVAHDVAGARDGQLSGSGASFVPGGISGNALRVDRSQDGYVQMAPMTGLVASNFTVVVWTKLAAGDTTPDSIVVGLHQAYVHSGFYIGVNTTGTTGEPGKARFYLSSASQLGTSKSHVNDGQWHQIALVYDVNGQTSLYVDGGAAEVSIPSAPAIEVSPPLLVGGVYSLQTPGVSQGFFTGWVDDLQIYDQALTEAEVGRLFSRPGATLQDIAVQFDPPGGAFVNSVEVRITPSVAGAAIRYTVDGSEPTVSSPLYAGPFTLRDTSVVRARLYLNEFPVSEVESATFEKVPPVTFVPPGGLFTNAVAVTLVNRVGLGAVMYTLDGTDPASASGIATGPLTLTNSVTIKARVFVNGFPVYEICTAQFQRVWALDDGVPNPWREQYFGPGYLTDPRVVAGADPDGDGWNNLLEFQSGTHPLDQASVPRIEAGVRAVPRIDWNSVPGLTYRVLRSVDVSATNWVTVLPDFVASTTNSYYIDAEAPATAVYLIERVRE